MFRKLLERLMRLEEQPVAPTLVPPRTKPVTPVRKPVKKPRTPIKPTPGIHPKPKANLEIELFKKVRSGLKEMAFDAGKYPSFVHPEKKSWIEAGDPELNELFPKLSEEEQTYLEMITSKAYQEMISRLERYTGVSADKLTLPQILSITLQSLRKVLEIEKDHRPELEKLAVDVIMNLPEYEMVKEAWENGEFKLDAKLGPAELDVEIDTSPEEGELSTAEDMNAKLADAFEDLNDVKLRRRLANLLIQGSATLKTYLFNIVNDELSKIDKSLPRLYGILAVMAQLGYWITPSGIEAGASGAAAAGSSEVIPEGEDYVIKVRGTTFPYLVHEIAKGIAEWASLDPEFKQEMEAETIGKETWDIIAGPEVYKVLTSYIPLKDQKFIPLVQKLLLKLSKDEIKDVLAKNRSGEEIMKRLLDQARDQWEEYKREEAGVGECRIDKGMMEGRRETLYHQFVESGKVPEEVFKEFEKSDPSGSKGKYLEWMLKQYTIYPERETHIIDVVKLFDEQVRRNKIKGVESDISRYNLEGADEIASEKSAEKSRTQLKKEIKGRGATKIKETDRYLIVVPESHEAACFYGAHTKWCISARTAGYWKSYWRRGVKIYIIIDKKENKKYAVAVDPDGKKTVYDEQDKVIPFDTLMRRLGISK
ncbi:MAG: hypothetical protein ACTSUO_08580 [Candidatus Thorarchaeota archaeon]